MFPPSMVTKLIKNLPIIIVLILATVIRGYNIDHFPSLNPDEAALGYNAYSLIQTGKDEHGISWPLHFKSFGDYKPGGYVYLAIPFIKTLGLNILATRLPNLILSIAAIYFVYNLSFLLSNSKQIAIITALILTISPWHIHFSRGAWESSAALSLIIIGVYLYYSNRLKSFLFPLILSTYIYHSARIVSPLIAIFLIFSDFTVIKKNIRGLILPAIVAVLVTIPLLISFINNGGTKRLSGVGLFSDYGPIARSEELLNQHGSTTLLNRIIHNKRVNYSISWIKNYTSHFEPNFLFINGDQVPRSKSPDMGLFYLIEFPFILIGIIYLIKHRSNFPRYFQLILCLLLVSPIASSLTFQSPSALRSLPLVIPITMLIGLGLYSFTDITARYFPHNLFLLTIIYIFSFYYFVDAYFIHSPQRYPEAWNKGFDVVAPYVYKVHNNYTNVYFTDKYDQPYILYLFYNQYSPKNIQSQIELTTPDKFGFSTVLKIDNINFRIPKEIPANSLIIEASDYQNTGQSFKTYTK